MGTLTLALLYVILAPVLGGLLAGLDRIISARMQGRVGPPLFQPFYDVSKLFSKGRVEINKLQAPLIFCHLVFMIFTGALFFQGGDILLIIFALAASSIFFILAAFTAGSPYSFVGAERELVILLAAEPVFLIVLAGVFKVAGTFGFYDVIRTGKPLIAFLPGMFFCLLYVLTMKFRKSPFDLSYSHHAHQELVKGITTDLGGRSLAMIEISHWYENIFLLGFVYLFFAFNPVLGIAAALFTYFLEILADNTNARAKWQFSLVSTWLITLVFGGGNLIALYFMGM